MEASAVRRRGIGSVISRLEHDSKQGMRFDRATYRQRNQVERTIGQLKQFRTIAPLYAKRTVTFDAALTITTILM